MISGLQCQIDGVGVVCVEISVPLDAAQAPRVRVDAVYLRTHKGEVYQPAGRVDVGFQPWDVAELRPHIQGLLDALENYLASKSGLFTGGSGIAVPLGHAAGIIDFPEVDTKVPEEE